LLEKQSPGFISYAESEYVFEQDPGDLLYTLKFDDHCAGTEEGVIIRIPIGEESLLIGWQIRPFERQSHLCAVGNCLKADMECLIWPLGF
jgi:hypothetical protein